MAGLLDTAQGRLMGLLNIPTELQRFATNPQAFLSLLGVNKLPKETGFAAGATGLPAQNVVPGGILNPPNLAYQQGYEQGEPFSYAAMAAPMAIPAGKAIAPKAYDMLENYMVKTGGMLPLTAYHGSPYRFDKFDPTKVGAGEGAQVYGHGMYFAEHPAVAKPYSQIVPSGMSATPNRQLFGKDVEPLTPEYKVSQLVDEMGVTKAKKFISDWAKDPLPDQIGYVDNLQSIIANVAKKSDAKNLGASNIYKVDIPNEKIPKMLNWDIPLSEQPKSVQDIAWKYKDALVNQTNMKGLKNIWELDGADLYGVMQRYTMQDNGKLVKKNVDIKDVSEIMNNSDIPGIRYMNYQGKTSEGANTSNFVVFDPTDVKILERNNKIIEGLLD
jgi:hypothetical protein